MLPRLLALVPAAVAINFAIGRLVAELGLPVYLDTIGTVLATCLAGPGAGLLVGAVSQLLAGLVSGYQWLAFAPVQFLIVGCTAAAVAASGFRGFPRAGMWGAATGLVAGATSAVINVALFQGVTATGVTAVTTLLRGLGLSLERAVLLSSIGTDLLDKILTFALVGALLLSLPRRLLGRYPSATRAIGVDRTG